MSGFGERFRRAGYAIPKPLIEIDGKPIVGDVIDSFLVKPSLFGASLKASGGLLMLVSEKPVSINDIATATLVFSVPAEVALADHDPAAIPSVAWMGY